MKSHIQVQGVSIGEDPKSHHPIFWEDMFEKIGETDTNIYIYIIYNIIKYKNKNKY